MQPESSVTWGSLRSNAEKAMQPLPEGTRVPVIVEKSEVKTASTGSLMVVVTLAVFEGDHASRKLFNNFVLTPDNAFAMTMFFRQLGAFGLDEQFFAQLEQAPGDLESHLGRIADALKDRKAWLTMAKPREWQGVMRDNPGNFEPYAGQGALNFNPGLPASTGGLVGGPPVPSGIGNGAVPQGSTSPGSAVATPGTSTAHSGGSAAPPVPTF